MSCRKGQRIVLSAPEQRAVVLQWLKDDMPEEEAFRAELAARAEYECARYIMLSALNLNNDKAIGFIGRRVAPTKYGENPYQLPAGLYADSRVAVDP